MTRTQLKAIFISLLARGESRRRARSESLEVRSLRTVRTRKGNKPVSVQAQVRASSVNGWYTVTIHPWGPGWRWTCTCKDAAKGNLCKHTLAVSRVGLDKIDEAEEREAIQAVELEAEQAMLEDARRLAETEAELAVSGA